VTVRERGYDAVVYDLDGTLVDLAVSWDTVASDARELFAAHGHETDESLWEMLDTADEIGLRSELAAVLADHERAGARASSLAPCAAELPLSVPTGVCSLNCEAACRVALDTHGLADAVDAVVGRDTVPERKPDPEPLVETLDRLDVGSRALFVGDSRRDAVAADRAGVDFEWVDADGS
jgi:phosphoglycolate phosphatase